MNSLLRIIFSNLYFTARDKTEKYLHDLITFSTLIRIVAKTIYTKFIRSIFVYFHLQNAYRESIAFNRSAKIVRPFIDAKFFSSTTSRNIQRAKIER